MWVDCQDMGHLTWNQPWDRENALHLNDPKVSEVRVTDREVMGKTRSNSNLATKSSIIKRWHVPFV